MKPSAPTISGWTSGRHVPRTLDELPFAVQRDRAQAGPGGGPRRARHGSDGTPPPRNERARPTTFGPPAPSTATPRTRAGPARGRPPDSWRRRGKQRADAAKAARVLRLPSPPTPRGCRRLRAMPTLLRVPADVPPTRCGTPTRCCTATPSTSSTPPPHTHTTS
ncbi:hypothetical protein ACU686_11855 [Yinghuangia aomiensis]